MVFLRGQQHLDDAAQAGFATRFGDLTTAHPTVPGTKDNPNVFELDAQRGGGKANAWHTDVTFVDRPPAISVLRAITLPPYGGDTAWANTVTACESLSPALRAFAGQLWALHSNDYDYAARSGGGVQEKSARDQRHFAEVFTSTVSRPSTRWSACTRRPASGRCCSASSCAASSACRPATPGTCSTCSSST